MKPLVSFTAHLTRRCTGLGAARCCLPSAVPFRVRLEAGELGTLAASNMSWNYRLIHRDSQYAVHEVFYREDGTVEGWTEEPVFPSGDSLEEAMADLANYARAFDEPVLVETGDGKLRERG